MYGQKHPSLCGIVSMSWFQSMDQPVLYFSFFFIFLGLINGLTQLEYYAVILIASSPQAHKAEKGR